MSNTDAFGIKHENKAQKMVTFSAIDPYKATSIPSNKETEGRGQNWVVYGDGNAYPNFLYELYQDDATLQSIVDGLIDYCKGEEIHLNINLGWGEDIVNRTGEHIEDFAEKCFSDLAIFGGYYIQVIRDNKNHIKELYWLDYRYMRTDKDNQSFYYSEDFESGKSYGRCKTLVYPKFIKEGGPESSVYFYKRSQSRGTYATPIYNGAIKSIVTDMKINNFSLNEVDNNFTASALINFCNGIPDDKIKEEIERDLEEKFQGSENAGRFLISYNVDQDHATQIERIQSDDFDKRYETLQKRVQSQIFVSFRATPMLFGLPLENGGFQAIEYQSSYALFNRSVVQPIQNAFINVLDKIFAADGYGTGTVTIAPLNIVLPTE